MENAIDALKIAAGVLMFVLALSMSISSFSQADQSITAIVNMRDRDVEMAYENIKPSSGLTRVVGIETIIPTMYRSYDENIKIVFKDSSGNPMPIYYKTGGNGLREKDESGNDITVDYINLAMETYQDKETCIKHLDMILAGKTAYKQLDSDMVEKYKNQFYERYSNGFLEYIKNRKFEEKLGEYYEIEGQTSTQIKKRIITYQEVE